METWFPFGLILVIVGVLSVYSFVFMITNKISDPRVFIALGIADVFILSTMSTFAIIIGVATGHFHLDSGLLKWLGAATVGEVASMLGVILGWYFKGTEPLPPGTHIFKPDSAEAPKAP